MSLFQRSVEKKYLNQLDWDLIDQKYSEFQTYFGNKEIQENIRNAKEEQFQEGFLRELFVKIFGYTLNPKPNFNLTTELKNITNSKKTDGAILKGNDAIAVIELKGTDTTDLDQIETQAFGYKNHHPKCVYVITSNFEKLRFYIQNAIDHIDFHLFDLDRDQFALLWICLAKSNLLNDLPKQIKELSVVQEEDITKRLYADYSDFREVIYNNLVKNNPDTDKLLLFKKTQKLLDRFLFFFFAEDRLLLPPNSINEIINEWTTLKDELDEYVPLYDRFKKHFNYMNTGFKGKKYEIYAFNGGLFSPDEILDRIKIDDDILLKHTVQLSSYNYDTDIDVNILGHIFENSLGEIESVQAEIRGEKVNNQKTKRKKDGIFYTPKYITKYIVENTIGKLCYKKKNELGIIDEEYAGGRKNRRKETIKNLNEKLTSYREWLLDLTIVDPACGSGAFLNQALEFLIEEHQKVDELRAKLYGDSLIFSDITTDILEKNIYGVDLNEESVEIAKLSLWLRTAQKGRKLNTLSNNIKCGNSLIDNQEIAREKSFSWEIEFPHIFEKGGFDVVLGNPPYGAKVPDNQLDFLKNNEIGKCSGETYAFFYEKGLSLLKEKGYLGFITPDTWLRKDDFEKLRKYLLKGFTIEEIIETGPVFRDARDTWCLLLFIRNKKHTESHKIHHLQIDRKTVSIEERQDHFEMRKWLSNEYSLQGSWLNKEGSVFGYQIKESSQKIIRRLMRQNCLGDNENYIISRGEEGAQSKFDLGEETNFNMVKPEQISKYYTDKGWTVDHNLLAKGKLETLYTHPKIFVIRIQKMRWVQRIVASLDTRKSSASLKTLQIIVNKNNNIDELLVLESILNSTLINFWCVNFLTDDINSSFLKKLPLPNTMSDPNLSISTKKLKDLYRSYYKANHNFEKYIASSFSQIKLSRKLHSWYELEFKDFIMGINKINKVSNGEKLSKSDEMEWMELFESKKAKTLALKSQIEKTDKEIDQMVYELYGLSEEEIKIVEGAI